jgi:uncharacterized cupredoxin-like copper-binding protein
MRLSRLALLPAAALLVVACSAGAGSGAVQTGGPAASPSAAASASSGTTRVDVKLTDELQIEPAAITVPAGVPVTFVVTNAGSADHEFFLGDEAAQAAHEEEMMEMGGMGHDEPEGIAVDPGETKELTYTFTEPGQMLAGCHVVGHYGAGMKASITVTE